MLSLFSCAKLEIANLQTVKRVCEMPMAQPYRPVYFKLGIGYRRVLCLEGMMPKKITKLPCAYTFTR